MKKLLVILLCVPLLFSCGEESKDINIEEEKSNTEQSDNTENKINTVKMFDSANIEGECGLSKYLVYLVNELNNLAENSNEENVKSLGLKSKRRAKILINEMLNAADWGRKNELDISTMKKCEEFIENEGLLNDELLEEFYKEMYKELINERAPSKSLTNKEKEDIKEFGKARGWQSDQVVSFMKHRQNKNNSKTRKDRANYNPYLWRYK